MSHEGRVYTEFWLIRHGETDYNLQRKTQGHTDVDLNSKGIEQAKRLGSFIARYVSCSSAAGKRCPSSSSSCVESSEKNPSDFYFYKAYSSDLKRALHTAQSVVCTLKGSHLLSPDCQIIIDARLRELNFGILSGYLWSEHAKRLKEHYESNKILIQKDVNDIVVLNGDKKTITNTTMTTTTTTTNTSMTDITATNATTTNATTTSAATTAITTTVNGDATRTTSSSSSSSNSSSNSSTTDISTIGNTTDGDKKATLLNSNQIVYGRNGGIQNKRLSLKNYVNFLENPNTKVADDDSESYVELQTRVLDILHGNVLKECQGRRVLVFCHGGCIKSYLCDVLGISLTSMNTFHCTNTSITRVRIVTLNKQIIKKELVSLNITATP